MLEELTVIETGHGGGLHEAVSRLLPTAGWFALIWTAEVLLAAPHVEKVRHGVRNLTLATINGAVLFFTVGLLSVTVAAASTPAETGLGRAVLGFLALDLFGYLWHVANHRSKTLWRFHAVHHSDAAMDVTTAGRFHIGELAIASLLRLPVIAAVGVSPVTLLVYETTLVVNSMFHHSSLRLGWISTVLQWLIVTPELHSIHHSRDAAHYDTNFASVLSIWDRLFGTWQAPADDGRDVIRHGIEPFDESQETVRGLLTLPRTAKTAEEAG